MNNYVEMMIIILFLFICSYYDIKERVIYSNICLLFGLVGILVEVIVFSKDITVLLSGIIPSIFIFLVSIISDESIGKGDALIFFVIGIILGGIHTLVILILALIITLIYSIPLIVFKIKKLKNSLPFSPFILISFIVYYLF